MPLTPNAPVAIFDNIFLIWTDQVWFCLPLPQYRDPILRPFMCLSVCLSTFVTTLALTQLYKYKASDDMHADTCTSNYSSVIT